MFPRILSLAIGLAVAATSASATPLYSMIISGTVTSLEVATSGGDPVPDPGDHFEGIEVGDFAATVIGLIEPTGSSGSGTSRTYFSAPESLEATFGGFVLPESAVTSSYFQVSDSSSRSTLSVSAGLPESTGISVYITGGPTMLDGNGYPPASLDIAEASSTSYFFYSRIIDGLIYKVVASVETFEIVSGAAALPEAPVSAVPLPAAAPMLVIGLAGLARLRRRRS